MAASGKSRVSEGVKDRGGRERARSDSAKRETREAPEAREAREARSLIGWARIWRDYSLSIVLAVVFLLTLLAHTVAGWYQYAADQKGQGDEPTLWGESGYVVYWAEWTFQNWQSEFLEAFTLVVFTALWVHKGSAESKDGQEQMQRSLDRIEERLAAMETKSR